MIVVNIIENLMIIVIIVDMGVKEIVKVMKGSGEYMNEKSNWIYGSWYFYLLGKWWVIE